MRFSVIFMAVVALALGTDACKDRPGRFKTSNRTIFCRMKSPFQRIPKCAWNCVKNNRQHQAPLCHTNTIRVLYYDPWMRCVCNDSEFLDLHLDPCVNKMCKPKDIKKYEKIMNEACDNPV